MATPRRGKPDDTLSPQMRAALSVIGRRGGRARVAGMTAEERRELAHKAAEARWGKKARRRRLPGPA